MILVIGTKDSGKSAFAEQLAISINSRTSDCKNIAYIATMQALDDEAVTRIEKHRNQRAGKGFITFEEAYCVSSLIDTLEAAAIDTVLLECVSNLVGNVMHSDESRCVGKQENIRANASENVHEKFNFEENDIVKRIVADIGSLDDKIKNLIVVTNYFDISDEYDDETKKYISINNAVSDRLKEVSKQYALKTKGGFELYDND